MKDEILDIVEKIIRGDSKHLVYKYLTKTKNLDHDDATALIKRAHEYLRKTSDSLDIEDKTAKRIAQLEKLYEKFVEVEDFRGASDVLKQLIDLEGLKNQEVNDDQVFRVILQ